MKVEAVKVRRLYLEVAGQIETLIRSGEIKPGERLPSERDLAASFEVSRPTIREAMIALEIAGLVEIRTGSGIYALPLKQSPEAITIDDVPGPFEVLEARLLIETDAPDMQLPSELNEHPLVDKEGKDVNHPANIRVVYRELAKFLEEPEGQLAKRVEENFLGYFEGF